MAQVGPPFHKNNFYVDYGKNAKIQSKVGKIMYKK